MEIRKSVNLFGEVKIGEVVVANFNANVSNNGASYNINVNFTNKELVDSTPENTAAYEAEYKAFEDAVKAASI